MATSTFPALQIQPPQQQDLLGQYARLMQIRNAQQQYQFQQQYQPLQLQAEQQQITQRDLAMKSEQAMAQAYIDSDGNWDQAIARARRAGGVLPSDVLDMQQRSLAVKEKYAQATETQLKNFATQNDNLRGLFDPVIAADPSQQPQLWQAAKQKALSDPNAAIKYGDLSLVPDYKSPQQVQMWDAGLKGGKQYIEDELKAAQTQEATQQAALAKQMQQMGGGPPGFEEAKYTYLQGLKSQGQTLTPDQNAFIAGYEKQKLLVPTFRVENRPSDIGTWSLQEDQQGNPILFNSKTGETQPAPQGIQKAGTFAKTIGPAQDALSYANDYRAGAHTGPGDEALMEKFFELAKPSSGFRMSQVQTEMLTNAQGWMNSMQARIRHATVGTYFSDTQRSQIIDTMNALGAAKLKHLQSVPGAGAASTPGGPTPGGPAAAPAGTTGHWGQQFGGTPR